MTLDLIQVMATRLTLTTTVAFVALLTMGCSGVERTEEGDPCETEGFRELDLRFDEAVRQVNRLESCEYLVLTSNQRDHSELFFIDRFGQHQRNTELDFTARTMVVDEAEERIFLAGAVESEDDFIGMIQAVDFGGSALWGRTDERITLFKSIGALDSERLLVLGPKLDPANAHSAEPALIINRDGRIINALEIPAAFQMNDGYDSHSPLSTTSITHMNSEARLGLCGYGVANGRGFSGEPLPSHDFGFMATFSIDSGWNWLWIEGSNSISTCTHDPFGDVLLATGFAEHPTTGTQETTLVEVAGENDAELITITIDGMASSGRDIHLRNDGSLLIVGSAWSPDESWSSSSPLIIELDENRDLVNTTLLDVQGRATIIEPAFGGGHLIAGELDEGGFFRTLP